MVESCEWTGFALIAAELKKNYCSKIVAAEWEIEKYFNNVSQPDMTHEEKITCFASSSSQNCAFDCFKLKGIS